MPNTTDPRQYTTTRLRSNHGYDDPPIVDDSLPSALPLLTQRTGRLVQFGRELCEIWSPNSAIHPYLPGVVPKGFDFSIPDDPRHRRYDGHLGRFDYTVIPQMFSGDRPWRGFIRRPFAPESSQYPEFAIIHQLWKPSPSSQGVWPTTLPISYIQALHERVTQLDSASAENSVIAQYYPSVWEYRPLLPTHAEIDQLGSICRFEQAVDLVLEVQRRIRDFDAWYRYGQMSLHDFPTKQEEDLRRGPQYPANDEWIGAWINGASKCDILHALYWRMPCFIAHILSPDERSSVARKDLPARTLIDGTDVTQLDATTNGYDFIAERSKRGYTRYVPTLKADPPSLSPEYRARSASAAHGWTGRWYSGVEDSQKLLKCCPPPPLSPLPDHVWSPPVSAPEALPLDTVVLDAERAPWLRPPPVMPYLASEKMSHWIEDVVAGKDGMREVAKSKGLQTRIPMHDREHKRKLYFHETLRPLPGAVSDSQVFGMPLPPLLFKNRSGKQVARSTWVYHQEKPSPGDSGRLAPTPEPSSLPLLASISAFPDTWPDNRDDDEEYIPELDDNNYLLPNYPASMSPSPAPVVRRPRYVLAR